MNTFNYIKDNLSFGTTFSSDIVDRLPLGGDFFIMEKKDPKERPLVGVSVPYKSEYR